MTSVSGLSLPEVIILRKVLRPPLIAAFVGVVARNQGRAQEPADMPNPTPRNSTEGSRRRAVEPSATPSPERPSVYA
jgi:hypothetical protein